jgi:N-acyl-phosphatidylethanolamine-hydrolysing phospholipase D
MFSSARRALVVRAKHRVRTGVRGAIVASLACVFTSCSSVNPYFDASKPHHRPDGFQNNDVEFEPKGIGELLRWRYDAWKGGLPKPPAAPTPSVSADLDFIHANAAAATMQPAVTWIGHSSVLAQVGGLNLLIDPIFSERASPFSFVGPRRAQPPGLTAAQLPHIDVVLVSHNHYDHLDIASIDALNRQPGGAPIFVVPLGLKPWLEDRGVTTGTELDWWQSLRVGATEITLTPAQHWSSRSLGDRMKTLWGGFAVISPSFHLFYSGDTAYSADFADIRRHFAARQTAAQGGGFDLALLPVGAYEPRWFMKSQHTDPEESVQIREDLGARRAMGVHWGTFSLTDEPLDEPPRALARARAAKGLSEDDFFVLAVGETRKLRPRLPPQAP